MNKNKIIQPIISLRQKITLIAFGSLLFFVLLETGLRLGGFIFLFLQENRNKAAIYARGAYRIMCLGESTTGEGGQDSYPSQLQEILNERKTGIKFSVINKGIPGTKTSNIILELEGDLNRYKPDMVITMMGVNDLGEHLPYKSIANSKIELFFGNFRIYKFARLFWLHTVTKAKET